MDDVGSLRAEIDALRGRLRYLALAVGAGGLVLGGLLVHVIEEELGGPSSLVVGEVVLVGDDGTVRGRLGTTGLGDAQLTLSDAGGNERVWLKAGDRHGTFEITDAEHHTQVRLSAIENLSGLHLAHGTRSAQMTASTETTAVTLVDLDESASAVLRAEPAGTDLQLSRNKTGESPSLATLSAGPADPEKGAVLTLAGPQQFLQATVNPSDGEPRIVLAGETRIESRTTPGQDAWLRFERAAAPP